MNEPLNKKLYEKVKKEAKKKFDTWPSAYASAWLVKEYKKRGGKYKGKKKSNSGLSQWFEEKWVDVCYLPKKKSCGRSSKARKYPYCRPSVRINKKTPKTIHELSKSELKKRCKKKQSYRKKRMSR